MPELRVITESPFCNTYGGLSLVQDASGQRYLQMGDCFGPSYWGPLNEQQIAAFGLLCSIDEAGAAL